MKSSLLLLGLTILSSANPITPEYSPSHDLTSNANHIFNAIHSSMRQWGSSLNHNGMSFFLATVPKGTQLYHGSGTGEPVSGMEWLAFEPEHSLIFAGRARPMPGKVAASDGVTYPPLEGIDGPWRFPGSMETDSLQRPLSKSTLPNEELGGYLHTYRAPRDLRLLYIDGESAAKSIKGTLDTQNCILLNDPQMHKWRDYERAQAMCDLALTEWGGRIDGILRMEGGFEIIMCSFQASLERVRVTRAKRVFWGDNGSDEWAVFDYFRAVAARYDGIGGGRVQLNYDRFVTAFDGKYGIDLFRDVGGRVLPRLVNASAAQLRMAREDVDRLVLHTASDAALLGDPFNWQAIADMVVSRYTPRLKHIVSGALPTLQAVRGEIERTLQPFIDYARRNATSEVERCAMQFIPDTAPPPSRSMAAAVILHISRTICSTLLSAGEEDTFEAAVQRVRELIDYLGWTSWVECQPCDPDQLCMLPIWEWGTLEDFTSPRCLNSTQIDTARNTYWDFE